MSHPFQYPTSPLERRHEPRGYERPSGYHPWLRDEFTFRCVYCLIRETWLPNGLEVEHFEPVSLSPERVLEYENLLYACRSCNGKKGNRSVPDPCATLTPAEIELGDNGLFIAKSCRAKELILVLGLNTRRLREYRRVWIDVIRLAERHDPELYRRLMGYPRDLPNLSLLRPPDGNGKPEGIAFSCHSRRERGELEQIY